MVFDTRPTASTTEIIIILSAIGVICLGLAFYAFLLSIRGSPRYYFRQGTPVFIRCVREGFEGSQRHWEVYGHVVICRKDSILCRDGFSLVTVLHRDIDSIVECRDLRALQRSRTLFVDTGSSVTLVAPPRAHTR